MTSLVLIPPTLSNTNANSVFGFQLYRPRIYRSNLKPVLSSALQLSVTEVHSSGLRSSLITIERECDGVCVCFTFIAPPASSPDRGAKDIDLTSANTHNSNGSKQLASEPPRRFYKTRAALNAILNIGKDIAELCPNTLHSSLATCRAASQACEDIPSCDVKLEEFIVTFANLLGSIRLIFHDNAPSANSEPALTAIIELIYDVCAFVVQLMTEFKTEIPSELGVVFKDQCGEFLQRLKQLKIDSNQQYERTLRDWMEAPRLKLQPVTGYTHHNTRDCLPGTRTTVLADIDIWTKRTSWADRLLWIHGPLGVGKSAITSSICHSLETRNLLAASFFCRWDEPQLREPRSVMTSIVNSLSEYSAEYRTLVASAIGTATDLHQLEIGVVYKHLVEAPLLTLANFPWTGEPAYIIVDGLDECKPGPARWSLLVSLFGMSRLVPWLKVIVTGKACQDIESFFSSLPEGCVRKLNVHDYDAANDIQLLVRRPILMAPAGLAQIDDSVVDVGTLAAFADGFALRAEVACEFVANTPTGYVRLASLLKNPLPAIESSKDLESMDQLYAIILNHAFAKADDKKMAVLRGWLGIVVTTVMYTPLPLQSLKVLLGENLPPTGLDLLLSGISPILYEDQSAHSQGAVRVRHQTFYEYITTSSRSREFCLRPIAANTILSTCCLNTLLHGLRFNICNLETSHRLNAHVPNFASRVRSAIEPHLAYSCQYWIDHVISVDITHVDMGLLRAHLFGPSLIYWIEALSLLGKLDAAVVMLPRLMKWALVRNHHGLEDIIECVHDTYRFVSSFKEVISQSAPHLYLSALAFAPSESAIAQRSRKWFPNTLRVITGMVHHWTPGVHVSNPIKCLAVSYDGAIVSSSHKDGSVWLWDAGANTKIHKIPTSHLDHVIAMAFCPAGRLFVMGSYDCSVRIWDMAKRKDVFGELAGHSGPVLCVSFSPDGRLLVSASHDRSIRIWDTRTEIRLYAPFWGHLGPVLCAVFCPRASQVVSGSTDKTVRVWDVDTGASIAMLGHSHWVQSVAFSSDGRYIVSGALDKSVWVWNAGTHEGIPKTSIDCLGPIHYVGFSPDNRSVVAGSSNCTMQVWDISMGAGTLTEPSALPWSDPWSTSPLVYLFDRMYLTSGTSANTVQMWGPEDCATPTPTPLIGHASAVISVDFSPDGRRIVSGSFDNTVRLWDAETGNLASAPLVGHSDLVWTVAFSPDSQQIVSCSEDKTIRLWNVETGTAAFEPLVGHSGPVISVAFSHDGQRIVSGSSDKTVRLWDVQTGTPASAPLVGHSGTIWFVVFSPNGRRIVSCSEDNTVRLWDTGPGTPASVQLVGHSGAVTSVAFSPDSQRIVSSSHDKTLRLWDAETGTPVFAPFVGHSGSVTSIAFSPDGRRIVSGSEDDTVRLWDVGTGTPVSEPLGDHSGPVTFVAFSPDGRRIVSHSHGHTLRLWDAETGIPASAPLSGHSGQVTSVAFSPDGGRIVSGSFDHTIRIWTVDHNSIALGLPVNISSLPSSLQPGNWVSTPDQPCLFWLPREYHRPETNAQDDSLISIGKCWDTEPSPDRVTIDYSRFVHGTSWILVAAELS